MLSCNSKVQYCTLWPVWVLAYVIFLLNNELTVGQAFILVTIPMELTNGGRSSQLIWTDAITIWVNDIAIWANFIAIMIKLFVDFIIFSYKMKFLRSDLSSCHHHQSSTITKKIGGPVIIIWFICCGFSPFLTLKLKS